MDECAATLNSLLQRRDELTAPVRVDVDELLGLRAQLQQRIETLLPARLTALKTRYHGDFHLGQVLLQKNDFVIIDFEGEPGRSLAERCSKHSPLRDVAGMLRSLNYARHMGLKRAVEQRPEDYERLEPAAALWEDEARRTFLSAYENSTRGSALFGSFEEMRPLLALFEIEKALYELRYELGNRPEWVYIPLRGLLILAGST